MAQDELSGGGAIVITPEHKDDLLSQFSILDYSEDAKNGNVDAQMLLGISYLQGFGVEVNVEEAVKWLTLAADQGNSKAIGLLAQMSLRGEGIPENKYKGIEALEKAAELGDGSAMLDLALIYLEGKQRNKDVKKAVKFLEEALKKYEFLAALMLGELYFHGDDISKDLVKAYMYFDMTIAGLDDDEGYELAELRIKELNSVLTKAEINQARKMHLEWINKYG